MNSEKWVSGAKKVRDAYKQYKGPSRRDSKKVSSGAQPTIGAPPKSAPKSYSPGAWERKHAQIARGMEARGPGRARSAGPMGKRRMLGSKGPGAGGAGGAGAENGEASSWWKNPILWVGAGAVLLMRRKK